MKLTYAGLLAALLCFNITTASIAGPTPVLTNSQFSGNIHKKTPDWMKRKHSRRKVAESTQARPTKRQVDQPDKSAGVTGAPANNGPGTVNSGDAAKAAPAEKPQKGNPASETPTPMP